MWTEVQKDCDSGPGAKYASAEDKREQLIRRKDDRSKEWSNEDVAKIERYSRQAQREDKGRPILRAAELFGHASLPWYLADSSSPLWHL